MTLNMMRPCHLNPLLSAHEAMDGLFLFDATLLAPLGTKVLVHLKPKQRKSWGYHVTKAWYLSHAANHYQCIRVIMKDTGGERITITFRFQHHALLVPHITATDCIFQATEQLTDVIAGVQEVLPNKLAAITSLRALLLGKELPPEPVKAPVAPTQVTTPIKKMPPEEDPPGIMWDPTAVTATGWQQTTRKSMPLALRAAPSKPVMIEDDDSNIDHPPPHQYLPSYPQPVCTPLTCPFHHAKPTVGKDCTHDQLRHCSQAHAVGHQPRIHLARLHGLSVCSTPTCHRELCCPPFHWSHH
jgi:hypothetical protein